MVTIKMRWSRLPRALLYFFGVLVLYKLLVLFRAWNHWAERGEPYYIPKHLRRYYQFQGPYSVGAGALSAAAAGALAARLARANGEAAAAELARDGAADSTVLLVQAGRDAERLQFLIISLAQVHYIHDVLLIFSHSYFDEKINNLIRSIRFCKVLQVFYPYSLQLNSRTFDPGDCNASRTRLSDDVNACSDRDALLVEHKQHWWWKANHLFHGFHWSHEYKGMVIFLEEDDYVLPDLLYVLKYTQRSLSYFPEVEVASFGRTFGKDLDYDLLTIDAWRPPYHRGLAFNKTTWLKIQSLSSLYCTYNDSSWSYSLLHLFERFPKGYVEMCACLAPRVLSTGVYESGHRAAQAAWRALRATAAGLYPRSVRAAALHGRRGREPRRRAPPPHGNGGWGAARDQQLCLRSTSARGATSAGGDNLRYLN